MGAAAILTAATAGPGWADTTCASVAAAMMRVPDQPGVHQRTMLREPSNIEMEAFLLPDAMYVRGSDKAPWNRLPIDQGERRAMARKALEAAPLSECTGPTTGLDGAMPVQIYRYRQPDLLNPGSFTASSLWIGGDGLPRRFVISETSYQTMEYGHFSPPTDLTPSKPQRTKPAR